MYVLKIGCAGLVARSVTIIGNQTISPFTFSHAFD